MVLGRVERQRDLIFWYMRHWDVSCSKCTLKRYFQIIFSKDNLKLCSHNIFWYMRHWDVPCSKCTLKRYFQIIFSKDNLRLSSHNIFLYVRYWDVPCLKLWPPKSPALLHFFEPSERHLMWVLKCFSIASEKC